MTVHVDLLDEQSDEVQEARSWRYTKKGKLVLMDRHHHEVRRYGKSEWDAVWRVA